MKKLLILLSLLPFSGFATVTIPSDLPENLVSAEYFKPSLSWCKPAQLWVTPGIKMNQKVENGIFSIQALSNGKRNSAGIPLDISYETADRFEISFQYRSKGKTVWTMNFYNTKRRLPNAYHEFHFRPSETWNEFKKVVTRTPDSFSANLTFYADAGGSLELKNLVVKPLEPEKTAGKEVVIGGKAVDVIRYDGNDYFAFHAAKIIQSQIYRAGGKLLPIQKGSGDGIVVGGAASKAGKGGYELNATAGKVQLSGNRPGGLDLGALKLLEKLGIVFYTQEEFTRPENLTCKPFTISVTPAIPMRSTGWAEDTSELLGYNNSIELGNDKKIGAYRGFGHSAPYLLPYEEFHKTHPEYFALQQDGKRLTRIPGKRFDVHFCMSNANARKIIADRMIEYMKSEPYATYFSLFPGDGGDNFCRCKECMAMGNVGERNLFWVNDIAKQVGKVCPDKVITTFVYVDSRFPPTKVFPAANVLVVYCPYEPVWMNHLIYDHPANAQGLKELAEWERVCSGNIGAYVYPSSCREKLNIWPAFYANLSKYKRFANNRYQYFYYCGLNSSYASGAIPDANSFTRLGLYVFGKVLIDPKTDVSKEINTFMKAFYGPAAPAMRRYFDLIHQEVVDRQWEQNTEKIVRGLVTKDLARKGYDCFAEAEKAASGKYLERVRKEKLNLLWHDLTDNCRGNGKISIAELPAYAEKLAEFCRIAKTYGLSYNTVPYKGWFWNTATLVIGNQNNWYDDPMIERLMKNPLDTLQKSIPVTQVKTTYGYAIDNQGFLGGERLKSTWLQAKPVWVTVLRRPSSGFGMMQCLLKLDAPPQKDAVLKIYGIDNEKKAPAAMELLVNGKRVYRGVVPWKKDDWSYESFPVPAKFLTKGENDIVLLNTVPDAEKDGAGGVNFVAKRNYYWGWFMVRDIRIELNQRNSKE